jgi:uncharacterized protein YcbK (DUF882 family)
LAGPWAARDDAGAFDADRRRALRALGLGALAAGGLVALPRRVLAQAPPESRQLVLHNTHTLETLRVEYCRDGAYCSDALARIDHVLRDHRTGDVHPMDPDLLDLLHDVASHCGRDAEFEVISGYRSPATNAKLHERSNGVASRSLHMDGKAIDVRLVGCDLESLRDRALNLSRGGVGYYRASQFVHLDTGRVRTWTG